VNHGEGGAAGGKAWLEVQRELVRLLAHDLRNPVAAILTNLNVLELSLPPESPEALAVVEDIRLAAEALLRGIDNQVALASLEAELAGEGARESMRPVSVALAAEAALARVAPVAHAAGIELRVALPAGGVGVHGERALLEQLVENLVLNATQHVRRGGRARLAIEAGATVVRIRLDDDGPPFGAAGRDFSRGGQLLLKELSAGRYSRGLGLYLVGLAVRALGGSVHTRAEDGHGHVEIVLPRAA
jgi:signal transduction histidine kinase